MVCHYNSCTLPQLGASDVCFDLFGREQDLSVAYSRDGQVPEWTSSNIASLTALFSVIYELFTNLRHSRPPCQIHNQFPEDNRTMFLPEPSRHQNKCSGLFCQTTSQIWWRSGEEELNYCCLCVRVFRRTEGRHKQHRLFCIHIRKRWQKSRSLFLQRFKTQ